MYYYKKQQNSMQQLFDLKKITDFRHELHHNPELSDNEYITAERIANFLHPYKPDQMIRGIGGNGIACIFKGKKKALLFYFVAIWMLCLFRRLMI